MRASDREQFIGSVKVRTGSAGMVSRSVAGAVLAALLWTGEMPGIGASSFGRAEARSGSTDPWIEDFTELLDSLLEVYGCSAATADGGTTTQALQLTACFDSKGTPAGLTESDRVGIRATVEELYCMVRFDSTHLDNITRIVTKNTLKLMYLGAGGNPLLLDFHCS